MFEKRKFPWLDDIHPDLRPLVLGAKKRGLVVSYNAEAGSLTLESKEWRPLAGVRETYDAKTGILTSKAMS